MIASRESELRALAISESSVRPDGTLTTPLSFGVYRVSRNARGTRPFRFGNHPIRQLELIREFGAAQLEALFSKRVLASELANLLNRDVVAVAEHRGDRCT
jgi:hypothetical protein